MRRKTSYPTAVPQWMAQSAAGLCVSSPHVLMCALVRDSLSPWVPPAPHHTHSSVSSVEADGCTYSCARVCLWIITTHQHAPNPSLECKSLYPLCLSLFGGERLRLNLLCGHVSESHIYACVCVNAHTEIYVYVFLGFQIIWGCFFCDSVLVGTKAVLKINSI